MSTLQDEIEQRHRPDKRRDIIFLIGAMLLVALSLGTVTSKAVGAVHAREWSVTVLEGALEVGR